jgi:hypothetical protein
MTLQASTTVETILFSLLLDHGAEGLLPARWKQLHHSRQQSPAVKLEDVTVPWVFFGLGGFGILFWELSYKTQNS